MRIAMAAIGLALLAGCQQQYYRITDVQTGKEFYTRSIEGGVFPTRSGTAGFTDITTGDRVSPFLPRDQDRAGGGTRDATIEVMTVSDQGLRE